MDKSPSLIKFKYIAAALLALSIGLYFRLFPLLNYSSSENNERATVIVINKLQQQFQRQVAVTHPELNAYEQNLLSKKFFDATLKRDGEKIRSQIDQLASTFEKSSSKKRKFPYLLESDPFYYYNLTENILKTGHMSDEIKGSKYLNKLMLAPVGHWEPLNLNPYVGFFIFKLFKIFDPNIALMDAVSFTPLFITSLSLIVFVFICMNLCCNPVVTFCSSTFFLLSPIFIKRSTLGWYDNDPYNVFFVLLILYIFFCLLDNKDKTKSTWLTLSLILAIVVYTYFWQGWMYIFSVAVLAWFIIVIKNLLFSRTSVNKESTSLKSLIIFILGTFLAIGICFGFKDFFVLFQEGIKALREFLTPQLSIWPDIYISVSELHAASVSYVIEYTGGLFFIVTMILGIIALIFNSAKDLRSSSIDKTIILAILLTLTFKITLGAQRFTILLFIPMSIFFAIGLKTLFDLTTKPLLEKNINPHFKKIYIIFISLIIFSLALIPIKNIQQSIRKILTPIFNQTWENALLEIKEKTPEDSIINTWWPPGHFIKAIAQRRVTFDGATINFPQSYWMANVFLSTEENQGLGLLRMLNNSANKACEFLENLGFATSTSVEVLKEITPLSTLKAKETLRKYISENDKIDQLTQLTHGKPAHSYILLYNEFVDNNIQLPFIGNYNFKKVEMINKNPALLKKVPTANSKEYVDFLWNLAGGAYRFSRVLTQMPSQKDLLIFENTVAVNTITKGCQINSREFGTGVPRSLIYLENNTIQEKEFPDANLSYSVLIFRNSPNSYGCILLDQRLAHSMLIKLYFFNAAGLKHIKPFSVESDLTKRTVIKTFEVDWESLEKDLDDIKN